MITPNYTIMTSIQSAQNRLLRLLEGCTLKDRKSTKFLLDKHNLLSVNQLAIEIKMTETWKSINLINYPIKLKDNKDWPNQPDRMYERKKTKKDHSPLLAFSPQG